MTAPLYRITKWKETYEKSDAKRAKNLNWFSVPTSTSSHGYQSLLDEFDGLKAAAMYGVWLRIVAFSAGLEEHLRGTLVNGKGAPIPTSRIAREQGLPRELFDEVIAWAARQDIGWLELMSPPVAAPADSRATPGNAPDDARTTPGTRPDEPHEAAPSDPRASSDSSPADSRATPGNAPDDAREDSADGPGNAPDAIRTPSVLQTGQDSTRQDKTDGRTDERASDRSTDEADQYEPIILTPQRWAEAVPLMTRIASIVDPGYRDRGLKLRAADRQLCWTVAALSLWHFADDQWLEAVLKKLADRREPPPQAKRWAYFRGAMITATKDRGEDFHVIERRVRLSPEVAEREATKPAKPPAAPHAPVTAA